jgi:hypothetical protein
MNEPAVTRINAFRFDADIDFFTNAPAINRILLLSTGSKNDETGNQYGNKNGILFHQHDTSQFNDFETIQDG